ncbi:alpha/beta hydrolase [Roseisalinus antarcticus]|uniref:Putative hydrolase MhqD n=1 Tax=Roseisalinus antarcticus TaxID=254357 RepID=A0A1Y5SL55_9RHOB|nr:alpha/beta hydrolase [Roseisalinus antarcticus]SLN43150.1 Putative hydrolase MhqD [Roseisalinus antarcticus]
MTYQAAITKGTDGAPLVLTFHGTGATEDQFHEVASALKPGAHVVSPRGDVSENGALRYFRRTGEGVYDMDDLARRTQAMAGFIAEQKARVDAPEVIGLGYSNGANILASVSFSAPELVDRLVLMHPLIPFAPAPQPGLSGRKVLVTAGRQDPICPAASTERLVAWFEAQGAAVTVAWHPGGHEIRQEEVEAISAFLT